ncbi:hypothetical protein FMN50_04810 [Rhodobacterales bacterium]|nr:hypothetical protein FMN50_04810 [Rhodobacterales bacterium]
MYHKPFAGLAADLIENTVAAKSPAHEDAKAWQQAAEDCVLARIKSLRLVGGLPCHKAPLSAERRLDRLHSLLQLWANGCTCAVDEDLFADIVNRRRQSAG